MWYKLWGEVVYPIYELLVPLGINSTLVNSVLATLIWFIVLPPITPTTALKWYPPVPSLLNVIGSKVWYPDPPVVIPTLSIDPAEVWVIYVFCLLISIGLTKKS